MKASHKAQMLGYLNITGLEVALLWNFKEASLLWKRYVAGFDAIMPDLQSCPGQ